MTSPKISTLIATTLLLLISTAAAESNCDTSARGQCYNKPEALRLKLIAIAGILVASMIGVCLPLFSRSVPALRPDTNIFVLVKAFASGVILATGYMHVLPDSFDDLHSPCLPKNPWSKFPFTTFVAMLSALVTLMIDSLMMARFNIRHSCGPALVVDQESQKSKEIVAANGGGKDLAQDPTIARHRIVAQVSQHF